MATPTNNSVQTTDFDTSVFGGDPDTLLYGTKWAGALGTGATLTYSFPQGTSYWLPDYSDDSEPDAYNGLSDAQMAAAREALASWAAVANLAFVEVEDSSSEVGEIRFGFTSNLSASSAAHAYMPGDTPAAGDVWFGSEDLSDSAAPGSYLYNTMIHEIGHALGLNHSFDIKSAYDNYFYTIMSYTASPWSDDGDNYASFYPTTPMYYDIVAMQAIYGRTGLSSNAGNTTYTFVDAQYFETIFDTGGKDTIVYAGSDTSEIDLNTGQFCIVSQAIDFSSTSSRSTVMIGPRTTIENARGGGLNDRLTGNAVANNLQGKNGNDTIYGGKGDDVIVGGNGRDKLKGNSGYDRFDFNKIGEIGSSSHDVIVDFKHAVDDIDLSTIDASVPASGNNKFSFVKAADTTLNGKASELIWYKSGGSTFVVGDVDGDMNADFILELSGSKSLTKGDFIL